MASVSVGAVYAKSLRDAGVPTEFPPSSYKGKQYIDSKGCVFIRAGISGNVTWVPRVSRSRQQLCRQKPTFATAPKPTAPVVADVRPIAKTPLVKPVPKRVVTPKPVLRRPVKTAVMAPVQPVVRAYTPAPVRTRVQTRAQKPRTAVRRVVKTPFVTTPRTVVATSFSTPKPAPKRILRSPVQRVQYTCRNGQSYGNSSGMAVRCGPQAESPTGVVRSGYVNRVPRTQNRRLVSPKPTRAVALAAATPSLRAKTNRNAIMTVSLTAPPAGYVAVWKDDRQNPNRARGTAAGKAQMEMVWTTTVPRRLIAVSTSQDTRRRIVIRTQRKSNRGVTVLSTKSTAIAVRKRRVHSVTPQGGNR